MGRNKIFNESAALGKAMRLFWRQGYANTSVKQLLDEMDMLNGSFYHSFKDKKTIFIKSLAHYNQVIVSKRQEALAGDENFSKGIRALFEEIFITLDSKKEPNGCLVVNSLSDEVLSDKDIKKYLFNDLENFVSFLTERIQLSIDLEHTTSELPAEQLALMIATYIQGLFRMSNSYVKINVLKTQTNAFLDVLNL